MSEKGDWTKPRRPHQCVALDQNGKRCRKPAIVQGHYHGDSEIYGYGDANPGWVVVWFCAKHHEP